MKLGFRLFSLLLIPFLAAPAVGAILTSNGSFQMTSPQSPLSPPINVIKFLGAPNGNVYTNQWDGAPFAVGSEIRSVAAQRVSTATNGTQDPARLPNGDFLVIFTALRGEIVGIDTNGNPIAKFDEGRAFASSTSALAPLNLSDPATWAPSLLPGAIFAEYAIKPQEDVFGTPFGKDVNSLASGTNLSSANIFAGSGTLGDSVFLFKEDSTAAQNAAAVPGGLPGTAGDNFLSNVFQVIADPSSIDSLVSTPQQTVSGTGSIGSGFDGLDLASLNAISALALGGDLFATDLVTPGNGYTVTFSLGNPTHVSSGATNGDFGATLTGDLVVGQQIPTVPEPTMLVVFSVLFAMLASQLHRHRAS